MGKREDVTQRRIKEDNISDKKRDDRTLAMIAEERRGNRRRDQRRQRIQNKHFTIGGETADERRRRLQA